MAEVLSATWQAPAGVEDRVAAIRRDQRSRWLRGDRVPVEDYLDAGAGPALDTESALLLVHGEYLLRRELGETPALEDYARRFPDLADRLRMADSVHRLLAGDPGPDWAPEVAFPAGYEVLGELGRGGMGVVYEARQRDLGRVVALKMLRPGAAVDAADVRRFRLEAEAAARLDHPHIVPIHEVGRAGEPPYFSMKRLEGGSLQDRLGRPAEDPREAARLVAAVAGAVHHAHQRGILHRDLKPANILLDAGGRPYVADFGLARIREGASSLTHSGAVLGTPSYMAPEQATGGRVGVTTAADVYGLGAILYALLAGRPPFRASTPVETLRRVIDEEPVAPRAINPRVDRDLEAICLRAMAKSPAHRYPSAAAMAEDLGRYLRGEPVAARLVSPLGRLGRWCRRNPRLAASVGVATAGLVAATVLSIALAWAQYRAAESLRAERANTFAEKRAAEDLLRIARSTVDDFLVKVSDSLSNPDPRIEGIREASRAVLDNGVARYRELVAMRPDDPELRAELGRLYNRLGLLMAQTRGESAGVGPCREAVALQRRLVLEDPGNPKYRRDLSASLYWLGLSLFRLGSHEEGLGLERESLALAEAVAASRPDDLDILHILSAVLAQMGYDLCDLGRKDEGIAMIERGIGVQERVVRLEPGMRRRRELLALAYQSLGEVLTGVDRPDEALDAFRRALRIGEELGREDPTFLASEPIVLTKIGHTLYRARRPAEALPILLRARDRLKGVLGDRTYPLYGRAYQGDNLLRLGEVYQALGRPGEALDCLRQAEAIHRALNREDPKMYWYRCSLALALRFRGGLLRRAGRHGEALPALSEARSILEAMAAPTNFDRLNLAACLAQLEALAESDRPTSGGGPVPDREGGRALGDRAMDLLREAAAKSKPRPSRFYYLVDPDLEPLRSRADFRALIRDLGFVGSPRPPATPAGPGLPSPPPEARRTPAPGLAIDSRAVTGIP